MTKTDENYENKIQGSGCIGNQKIYLFILKTGSGTLFSPCLNTHREDKRRRWRGPGRDRRKEEVGGATWSSTSLSHSRNLSGEETMASIKILKSSLSVTKSLKTLANFLSLFTFKANLPNQLLVTWSFILT